jgi:hypothetical protein
MQVLGSKGPHVPPAVTILAGQDFSGFYRGHQFFIQRIDNGGIKPCKDAHVQKSYIEPASLRQTVRNI